MAIKPISIIIPVYKNYEVFFSNLKKNKNYIEDCEIIIVNDYPGEKISTKVKAILPEVSVIENNRNLGFSGSVNVGIQKSTGKYIFLMNSDVVLFDDSFKESLKEFTKNNKIFALSFAQSESDNKTVGANFGYFKNGMINHSHRPTTDNKNLTVNFWAEGGSSIFSRSIVTKIGCFDEIYSPFYWEDIDLSYRAWKCGYEIYYYPRVKVQHFHETTIAKYFTNKSILKIAYRNQFIFQWKNVTDKDLVNRHLSSLPKLILVALFKGNWQFLQGFLLALSKLFSVLTKRKNVVKSFIKTDKEILNLISAKHE